jgi:hypothetical protein
MTQLLEKAISKIKKLPVEEQDAIIQAFDSSRYIP